jgi:hypothetical protein
MTASKYRTQRSEEIAIESIHQTSLRRGDDTA